MPTERKNDAWYYLRRSTRRFRSTATPPQEHKLGPGDQESLPVAQGKRANTAKAKQKHMDSAPILGGPVSQALTVKKPLQILRSSPQKQNRTNTTTFATT